MVRGLHVPRGDGEAKLVRCSYGAIFDVIVDLLPTSPSYRNWESFELCDDEQVSLYVPAGCAHGFQALTPNRRTCLTALTVLMTLLRVYRSPLMIRSWPSRGPLPLPRCLSATGLRRRSPLRHGC